MREFSSGRVNLNSRRTFDLTLDQGETRYYAEIDIDDHKNPTEILTQEVYWVIDGQEVLHRRLIREGAEDLDKSGVIATKCFFAGQIDPRATAAKVYIQTNRPVMSAILVRLE